MPKYSYLRKYPHLKIKRSPEGGSASQPEPVSPQTVAAFIVRGLVKSDTYRDVNLAKAAVLSGQALIWEAIASQPDLDSEIRAAATAEIAELNSLTADLRRRAVQSETRSGILFEAAKLPKFAPHIADELRAALGKTSAVQTAFGFLFPEAFGDERATLLQIVDQLGVTIPSRSPQVVSPIPRGRSGR